MLKSVLSSIVRFAGFTPAPTVAPPPPRRRPRAKAPVAPPVAPPAIRFNPKALAFRSLPSAARCVRRLQYERDSRGNSGVGLANVSVADARESLGPELAAFVDLCLSIGAPLPSQDLRREDEDDALYRGRLRRAMLADLDLWAARRDARARERIEHQEAGVQPPDAFYVPPSVEEALIARAAARAREAEERRIDRGGRGGGGMGARPPGAKVKRVADDPPIPAGEPPDDQADLDSPPPPPMY